jgi:SAM-dependent methyltransferase
VSSHTIVGRLTDYRDPGSLSSHFRSRRDTRFLRPLIAELEQTLGRPVRILDVGGRVETWINNAVADSAAVERVLVTNHDEKLLPPGHPKIDSQTGVDARAMEFADAHFDLAFSNSVIEHVPGRDGKRQMVEECLRVARCLYIQTPNRWFPIDPHHPFPGFQFLPLRAKVFLLQRLPIDRIGRIRTRGGAEWSARQVELLSARQLRELFPAGARVRIARERFLLLSKSLIAIIPPSGR